jgi:hypothetical protein
MESRAVAHPRPIRQSDEEESARVTFLRLIARGREGGCTAMGDEEIKFRRASWWCDGLPSLDHFLLMNKRDNSKIILTLLPS